MCGSERPIQAENASRAFSCDKFSAFIRSSSARRENFSRFLLEGMKILPTYSFNPETYAADGSDSLKNSKISASTGLAGFGMAIPLIHPVLYYNSRSSHNYLMIIH